MESMDSYKVDLKSMTEDAVSHRWTLTDDFFSVVQGPEIKQGKIDVALRVKQTSGAFELTFQFEGTVKVECDRCLELMDQPIQAEASLLVKLGEEYMDDGDMVIIPEDDGVLDLSWHLYEMIALEIPLRHVHPDGECNEEVMERLSAKADQEATDPRWDALKQIINKQ